MLTPEQQQRLELLKEIRAYIDEHGLFDAGLDDIASGVGIDGATLREFFDTKDDLISDLVALGRVEGRAIFATLESDDTLSLAEVRKRQWSRLSEHRSELRFFFEAFALAIGSTHEQQFIHGMNDWLDFFSASLLRRGTPPARAQVLASLVIAVYRGAEMDFLATGDRSRLDAMIEMWAEAESYLAKAPDK